MILLSLRNALVLTALFGLGALFFTSVSSATGPRIPGNPQEALEAQDCRAAGGRWQNRRCTPRRQLNRSQEAWAAQECSATGGFWRDGRCVSRAEEARASQECGASGGDWVNGQCNSQPVEDQNTSGGGAVPGVTVNDDTDSTQETTDQQQETAQQEEETERTTERSDETQSRQDNQNADNQSDPNQDPCTNIDPNNVPEECLGENVPDPREEPPGSEPGDDTRRIAEEKAQQAIDECKQAQRAASSCCNNPMKCTLGLDLGGGGAMTAILSGGAAMAMGNGGGDIAKACQTMKMLGFAGAGLNGASAAKCHNKQSTCLEVCESKRDWYASQLRSTPTSAPHFEAFRQAELQLSQTIRRCEGYSANVDQLAQQAVQDGFAAKMSDLCEQQAKAGPDKFKTDWEPLPEQPNVAADCSDPANKNHPLCKDPCQGPGAETNPFCRAEVPGLGDGASEQSSTGFGDDSSFGQGLDDYNVGSLGPEDDGTVSNLGEEVPITQTKSGTVAGNGGGFGGGGGGGGGVPALPSTGGGQKGVNTDILKGVSGGGGYSVSQGGFANTGGFSGYGSGSGREKKRRDKFDLSKYLPGGEKDPRRKLAGGRPSSHPEIGGPHESIWTRISNRYRVICKLKRLMDCN